MHPITGKNYYSILSDTKFKDMCDELFEAVWNDKNDVVIYDKEEIIERISKSISYTRIMSENLSEVIK